VITIVGSLNLDFFIETPRLPVLGETVLGHRFRQAFGGKGANQASACARLGAITRLIGCVGADQFGREMIANLGVFGVGTEAIVLRPDVHSGLAFIAVDDQGGNQIIVAGGANAMLAPADVARQSELIRASRAVVAQLEVPIPAVETALRLARDAGVLTILNPAPAAPLTDEILQLCDWIVPNEIEAAALAGSGLNSPGDTFAVAAALRRRAPHAGILITCGAAGAWLADREQSVRLPAFPVQAIDTVGAGDAFVGAFAVRLAEGAPPFAAAKFASATAALAVTKPGAQEGLPTRAEVERFLNANVP